MAKAKDLETDPEATFKPKINPTKPKKGVQKEEKNGDKWKELHSQAEKYWRMKFDREVDAIEFTKDPDAYTFKPEILGDKRAGKQQLTYAQLKMQQQSNQEIVPIEYRE